MNILIVDSSVLFRERLVTLIHEIPGAHVAGFADDARTTREIATALQPDVVILDTQLFYGSGIDALVEVKQIDPVPVVIVLTSSFTQDLKTLCTTKGADYFLNKFSDIGQVEAILKELLRRGTNSGNP